MSRNKDKSKMSASHLDNYCEWGTVLPENVHIGKVNDEIKM